ncbi:uncharacterized protein LOC113320297 [Papaver somniferum]|uniref:uncharacterized protein LOC113320297 n=1 Tax=Papaver somniferum TaxID=3469 RepID=UPI000E700C88|nr:uncharacterized protein LOC113320297 [Papaver somniferum]XP_026424008.1 uncharacterized protein LOC113320297 [Papaver somniferum]
MLRSLFHKLGVTLKRKLIHRESSSSSAPPAKYFLFTFQNQNVVNKSRVISIFSSFSTISDGNLNSSDSNSSFVASYLINSCGLSENEPITASKSLNFKTKSNPDSVLTLLRAYGFTESHISKLINKYPFILSFKPDKTLKPKLDFFISKRLCGLDLANFILNDPLILRHSLNKGMIPSFDILKTIVQSDENFIKLLRRNSWILSRKQVKRLMVNLELLRTEGVPVTNISKWLIQQPVAFTGDVDSFKKIVQKVKEMGFDPSRTTFLKAIHGLASMTEANWIKKMDVYKRWGWSEDQIQLAFRKDPGCMMASEKKIMAVMDFVVNEMGHDSSSVAETPLLISCSLKGRIIPRCSVIKILVSKGLIKEIISLSSILTMVDMIFLEKFVKKNAQEVPELMEVFQGQLDYQNLIQN